MKRLKHYFPNYIITILLVFSIIGLSAVAFISNYVLNPSFYIDSAQKHNIYRHCANYAENYFEKSYGASGIPAEVYMEGLDEKLIKQAVDGKINAFFDYVYGKTEKIETAEIDFSQLEKNLSDYFEKFAQEHNVEVNDLFREQLDKTLKAAEKDFESFTNAYMLDYIKKIGVPQKLRTFYPMVKTVLCVLVGVISACILIMAVLNIKDFKSVFYWLAVSGLCASTLGLIPCWLVNHKDYFSKLIMRTDYIYFAVTGVLNDAVDKFMHSQVIILAVSAALMLIFVILSAIFGRKTDKD